jgi:hypothetical protein
MTASEILMVVFTAVIAVTGVVGAIIFGGQLKVMQGQLNELQSSGRQTDQLIVDNKILAKAAEKSAKVAEDSLFKLQRASVFMPDINSNWHPDTAREGKLWWHFRPIFQNTGNTQTREMITNVVFEFRDTPLSNDFTFPPNEDSSPAIIPPHGTIFGASSNLTDEQIIRVQKGTGFFYIYGTVTYHDVFDGTPVHTTKFCRQILNPLGDFTRPDKEVTEMFFGIVFPGHNTAD